MEKRETLQVALDETIKAYNKLIANVEEEKPKWDEYGFVTRCRFCKILKVETSFEINNTKCAECPLLILDEEGDVDCWTDKCNSLKYAIGLEKNSNIRRTAKNRLKEIKKLAVADGYVVKED